MSLYLYTERSTNLVYEVKLFDDFALTRPATPGFEQAIKRVSLLTLLRDFDEYAGDGEDFHRVAHNEEPIYVIN